MEKENIKILVVIPAYNEEKSIHSVIESIKRSNSNFDILVINDGSKDNTEKIVKQTNEKVITLPYNLGIGAAVQTGFLYAKRNNYDIVIQVDADGQHLPDEIVKIITPIKNDNFDVVIGSRFVERSDYKASLFRRLGMIILQGINSTILKKKITDTTSGFRAYNKKAINYLSSHYPDDYPEPEAIIILAKNNFRIGEVSVYMNARDNGKSSITSLKSLYYMVKVILAIFVDIFKTNIYEDRNGK